MHNYHSSLISSNQQQPINQSTRKKQIRERHGTAKKLAGYVQISGEFRSDIYGQPSRNEEYPRGVQQLGVSPGGVRHELHSDWCMNVLGNYSFKASCDGGGTVQIYNSENCPSDKKVAQGTNQVGLTVTGSPARCEDDREICGSMVRSQLDQVPGMALNDSLCEETCKEGCLMQRGGVDSQGDFDSIPYFLDACYNSSMDTSAYVTCSASGDVVTLRGFNNGNCTGDPIHTTHMEDTCDHEQSWQECDDNGENCVTETRTYKIDVVCQSQETNLIQEACELQLTNAEWTELCESAEHSYNSSDEFVHKF